MRNGGMIGGMLVLVHMLADVRLKINGEVEGREGNGIAMV